MALFVAYICNIIIIADMAGRKPIYNVDSLEVGDRLEIKSKMRKFAHQIAYSCSQRYKGMRVFKACLDGGHVYIKRDI